jgi:hypothetical protein
VCVFLVRDSEWAVLSGRLCVYVSEHMQFTQTFSSLAAFLLRAKLLSRCHVCVALQSSASSCAPSVGSA